MLEAISNLCVCASVFCDFVCVCVCKLSVVVICLAITYGVRSNICRDHVVFTKLGYSTADAFVLQAVWKSTKSVNTYNCCLQMSVPSIQLLRKQCLKQTRA